MNYENLINRIKQNDNSAIMEFYNKFYKEVYYVCYKITENEKDAEDIAQETLIKAIDKIDTLKNPEGLSTWLKTIANNLSINYLKKNRKFNIVDNSEEMGEEIFEENRIAQKTPEDIVADKEVTDILTNMINRLPREQRITIFMFYYEELSVKEIAEIMDCSEATVRSRINYARKALRKQVDELENKGVKLRCIAILPFLFTIYSFEKYGVCQRVVMPDVCKASAGLRGDVGSMKKGAEVAGEAVKMSLKAKIAIGAVAAVVLVGGTVGAVSLMGNNNNDTNEVIDNSDLLVEEENGQVEVTEKNEDVQVSYEEISLDRLGEYEFDYSVFVSDIYELNYVNIEDTDFAGTLDFSNGDIYPLEFEYNNVYTNLGTRIYCHEKEYVMNVDGYDEVDVAYFVDIIPDNVEAKFYKSSSYMVLNLHCEDKVWSINCSSSDPENENEDMETIKQSLTCICEEYHEEALNTEEFLTPIFQSVKLNTYEFDFSEYKFENVPYCYFTYENGYKIRKIDNLPVHIDDTKRIGFDWHENDKYVKERVRFIEENTAKIYEITFSENEKIRIYESKEGNPYRLGLIKDSKEYIQSISTINMTIDELVDFLGKSIKIM